MLPRPDDDAPLAGLDALDQERAADMVANRPRYAAAATPGAPDAPGASAPGGAEARETPPDTAHRDRP
jgi:hypothetical protein